MSYESFKERLYTSEYCHRICKLDGRLS